MADEIFHPNYPNVELVTHLHYLRKQVPILTEKYEQQRLELSSKILSLQAHLKYVEELVAEPEKNGCRIHSSSSSSSSSASGTTTPPTISNP
jgi:hypothetical protein